MLFRRISLCFLIELISLGRKLSIELEQIDYLDIQGITLAYVFLSDRRCVNEILIADGYAKPYSRFYCKEITKYQVFNIKARSEKKGLYGIIETFEIR